MFWLAPKSAYSEEYCKSPGSGIKSSSRSSYAKSNSMSIQVDQPESRRFPNGLFLVIGEENGEDDEHDLTCGGALFGNGSASETYRDGKCTQRKVHSVPESPPLDTPRERWDPKRTELARYPTRKSPRSCVVGTPEPTLSVNSPNTDTPPRKRFRRISPPAYVQETCGEVGGSPTKETQKVRELEKELQEYKSIAENERERCQNLGLILGRIKTYQDQQTDVLRQLQLVNGRLIAERDMALRSAVTFGNSKGMRDVPCVDESFIGHYNMCRVLIGIMRSRRCTSCKRAFCDAPNAPCLHIDRCNNCRKLENRKVNTYAYCNVCGAVIVDKVNIETAPEEILDEAGTVDELMYRNNAFIRHMMHNRLVPRTSQGHPAECVSQDHKPFQSNEEERAFWKQKGKGKDCSQAETPHVQSGQNQKEQQRALMSSCAFIEGDTQEDDGDREFLIPRDKRRQTETGHAGPALVGHPASLLDTAKRVDKAGNCQYSAPEEVLFASEKLDPEDNADTDAESLFSERANGSGQGLVSGEEESELTAEELDRLFVRLDRPERSDLDPHALMHTPV